MVSLIFLRGLYGYVWVALKSRSTSATLVKTGCIMCINKHTTANNMYLLWTVEVQLSLGTFPVLTTFVKSDNDQYGHMVSGQFQLRPPPPPPAPPPPGLGTIPPLLPDSCAPSIPPQDNLVEPVICIETFSTYKMLHFISYTYRPCMQNNSGNRFYIHGPHFSHDINFCLILCIYE